MQTETYYWGENLGCLSARMMEIESASNWEKRSEQRLEMLKARKRVGRKGKRKDLSLEKHLESL